MKATVLKLLPVVLAVLVLTGFALLLFTKGKPTPPPPLPNPNGYDDFVTAGEMLAGDVSGFQEVRDMGEEELRAIFASPAFARHGEALALAKLGLSRKSRVPLDYSATSAAPIANLASIRRVAYAFIAKGRLAQMENRSVDAAEAYLDLIRLGHESARGGTMINSMHGLVLEGMGLAYLEKLTPELDTKCCREMASALETIDEGSESTETILRQEKYWARQTYGLKGQIARLLTYRKLKQSEQKWAARLKGQQSQRRSLAVKLASRAFEQETGQPPKTSADLVPIYLKAVPQYPLLSTNIISSP